MIDHIVKNNETADEILEMYHLSLDELIESGIVQMRKSYKEETIMDNNMPKILKIPTFEYKITDINNEDYHYKENYISI